MTGYIKLWRKRLTSGILRNPNLNTFQDWCLLKASYKKHTFIVGFKKITLLPGQFIFGRKQAAKELRMSERGIRTCLKNSISSDFLTIKATNKFSVISITNWATYQSEESVNDQQSDQQVTSKRPTGDHKQEGKEGKKRKDMVYTEGFLLFWEVWHQGSKKNAFAAYQKVAPLLRKEVLAILTAQVKNHKERGDRFVPRPQDLERWFKNKRWEDEVSPSQPSSGELPDYDPKIHKSY